MLGRENADQLPLPDSRPLASARVLVDWDLGRITVLEGLAPRPSPRLPGKLSYPSLLGAIRCWDGCHELIRECGTPKIWT